MFSLTLTHSTGKNLNKYNIICFKIMFNHALLFTQNKKDELGTYH